MHVYQNELRYFTVFFRYFARYTTYTSFCTMNTKILKKIAFTRSELERALCMPSFLTSMNVNFQNTFYSHYSSKLAPRARCKKPAILMKIVNNFQGKKQFSCKKMQIGGSKLRRKFFFFFLYYLERLKQQTILKIALNTNTKIPSSCQNRSD